ncbi:sulfotransferase [Streptomyces sp. NBC_01775]|uniref:sulfotransferase family protein n=1 Tax=Streptomyces sp. NBC_01775 TaxID=2975939 RepID=UPI002DDAE8B7|nr:sulfotransferase [Streptomyces sp. NBC_01775]WSB80227.1 sulfotransferase [Streptomyces sp. NBC_01775]
MGVRTLTFVVGTGRSGSTALSRVLREHPGVLSLNELGATAMGSTTLGEEPLSGREFWARVTEPNRVFDSMIRSGAALPEFLYNRSPGRYSAETTGIPALSLMALPHLTDDPDALLDALEPRVTGWPVRPGPRHWEALFDTLAEHGGSARAAVERSGYSTGSVPPLRRAFPNARFVHLFRDGPDCALSMSRHPGYRFITQLLEMAELAGVASPSELTPERVAALPPHLSALLADRFDPALVLERPMPVTRFGTLWSRLVAEGAENLRELPEEARTTLSYERLLDAPYDELTRLARFLDVEPLPRWLDTGAAMLDGSRRGAALGLPSRELAALRESCAPGMRALGLGAVG